MLFFLLMLIPVPAVARVLPVIDDFWTEASGSHLAADSFTVGSVSETALKSQMGNGNRTALIHLIRLLVAQGRISEAEAWMEGGGRVIPVTRRDLGIALSWYGRFEFYGILSTGLTVPPDLEDDDYGTTLAAIVGMGWMDTSSDGRFHPDLLVGGRDLELLAGVFFPRNIDWDREWISMGSLDSLFAEGIRQGVSR
ncbi:MAG: hypothetical protein JXA64_00965 [Candidatus Fermentibacteraceae bacterium]|nr:hypothetical protein [Candidatus Fermentibacteraceae bacterium]MBN2607656.1 hypothetical protein [Candidatus Fermentibacteraceae bacterium]